MNLNLKELEHLAGTSLRLVPQNSLERRFGPSLIYTTQSSIRLRESRLSGKSIFLAVILPLLRLHQDIPLTG
jgi:hypothetical protein